MPDKNTQQKKPEEQKSQALVDSRHKFFSTLQTEFKKREGDFDNLLPKYLTPDRFFAVAYQAIARTPKLQECTIASILTCLMQSADLGLYLGGVLGHAYPVPFRNKKTGKMEAQFIPGYRGLAHLVLNAGGVKKIEARPVRALDRFELEYGSDPRIIHVPYREPCSQCGGKGKVQQGDKTIQCASCDGYGTAFAGPTIGYYCVAKLASDETQFEYMEREDIDAVRSRSKAKDDRPWVTDYDEMAKKTVFKRLYKWLPMTDGKEADRLARAIELDNQATGLENDAVETSAIHIQMPSDIFADMGAGDGSGGDDGAPENGEGKDPRTDADKQSPTEPINEQQLKVLTDAAQKSGISDVDFYDIIGKHGFEEKEQITAGKFSDVLRGVMSFSKKGRR